MPGKRFQSEKKNNKGALYQSGVVLSTGLDSPEATMSLGKQLVGLGLPRVWLLRGNLGAGKTTLVRGVLRGLGVKKRVTSPTFNLVKVYPVRSRGIHRVVHIDAYRIKDRGELAALDLVEILEDKKNLVLIEWPERLGRFWSGSVTTITLKHRRLGRLVVVRVRLR